MKSIALLGVVIVVLLSGLSCGGEKFDKNVKPNILLITIDTLRRDHVGAYGYPRATTPFIDTLAAKGVRFEKVVTPIPSTAGSHATILSSLHPIKHNLIGNGDVLSDQVQTIAEVLKTNGYYTIGAISVSLLTQAQNFSQGFDSFSDKWERNPRLDAKFPLYERIAPTTNQDLFKQIEQYRATQKDKPLFIWVHYFDPHSPYYEEGHITFKDRLPQEEKYFYAVRKEVDNYDKEIRFTDDSISDLYKYLEQAGITKHLVTCITSDHGEQFGEHGYTFGHADFYTENILVPLVINGYGIPKNKVVETPVSTMDIGVTLLNRVGLTFDLPTEGIDILGMGNKPIASGKRKFLIIGNPTFTRSVQMLGYPFSYIINFDYFHRYWFITDKNDIPENRFTAIQQEQLKIKDDRMIISTPDKVRRGLNYMVFRADITTNNGFGAQVKLRPFIFTQEIYSPGKKESGLLNVIYPVTIMDSVVLYLKLKPGTVINNFRYALIADDELPPQDTFLQVIENKINTDLLTLRRSKAENEFYDLSTDINMEKNVIDIPKNKPIWLGFEKLIYSTLKYYLDKKERLLQGNMGKESLTEEDKKMLKSLGYL